MFYVAVTAGVVAFFAWFAVSNSVDMALMRTVTVLVIACPHALGLAIPLVVARSTSLGAKNGLLVRDRRALETACKIDVITMDKTGTLTEGDFSVKAVVSYDGGWSENDVLTVAGSLERGSNHPLSAGILKELDKRGLKAEKMSDIKNMPGAGLTGSMDGDNYIICSTAYLEKKGIGYDREQNEKLSSQGNSLSYILKNQSVAGMIAQGDRIRPDAAGFIRELAKMGIRPVMLTGDNKKAAAAVAEDLGINDFHAELLPDDKQKIIKGYREKGNIVMMVGDGVNDAPALATADIGVAIGAGTDIAIDSADVVLVKSNPSDILRFISLARKTTRKMKQNLWWGAGYNIVAIPLAAGVLAPVGILLSPAAGAILMSVSTVVVAVNAILLKI